jgi:hypothetical protein
VSIGFKNWTTYRYRIDHDQDKNCVLKRLGGNEPPDLVLNFVLGDVPALGWFNYLFLPDFYESISGSRKLSTCLKSLLIGWNTWKWVHSFKTGIEINRTAGAGAPKPNKNKKNWQNRECWPRPILMKIFRTCILEFEKPISCPFDEILKFLT